MAVFKSNLLNHFKAVTAALGELGASASLNPADFKLEARFGRTAFALQPQFIERVDGAKRYTPIFSGNASAFIGWLPYFNKRWELSNEKLKFKEYAIRRDLRTPRHSCVTGDDLDNVIVKKNRSSFGVTIKGPFRHARECPIDAGSGEYYEQFIPGRIVKAWFWDEAPVCLEFESKPVLAGDGVSTVAQLAAARLAQLGKSGEKAISRCVAYLKYQGRSRDTVLAWNEKVFVDFRYGSPFRGETAVEDVNLSGPEMSEVKKQLQHIGAVLGEGIPADIRQGTVFTVDAILDDSNNLWVLEMNSNPFIHPYVYPAMFRSLAQRAAVEAREATSARAPVLA